MYFVLEFRNKCCHFLFAWDRRSLDYHRALLLWYLTQGMHVLTLGTKLLEYPVFSIHLNPKVLCANSLTLITHLRDAHAKKGGRQTKSQIFAKKPPAPKLVNTYFQRRYLLLIHIVTFPAEIMSSQWANRGSRQSAHLLFPCLFLSSWRTFVFPWCWGFRCLRFPNGDWLVPWELKEQNPPTKLFIRGLEQSISINLSHLLILLKNKTQKRKWKIF